MIHVVVLLEIEPARREEFLAAMQENAVASRNEPGCLRFEISADLNDPNQFALCESYVDEAAMHAHYETSHFQAWKTIAATGLVRRKWSVKGPVL